jgi:hypothetical protein
MGALSGFLLGIADFLTQHGLPTFAGFVGGIVGGWTYGIIISKRGKVK